MDEKLLLGPPGCGKTYRLIEIVKNELQNGVSPEKIGFVSFSKKAIEEAKSRTVAELGLALDNVPWFRTLHSIGFQWLGMNTDQVLNAYDFNKIGAEVGMIFDNNTATSMEDGMLPVSVREGNKYLETIGRAKLRCVSLSDQYNYNRDYKMSWPMLVRVDHVYRSYKKQNDKFDFTDMIQLFVDQGTAPNLDVLIVDEAQDLTPLQWKQVNILKQSAQRVWYAGDDDQAIHRWMGVDVNQFMKICNDIEVLKQSYRVPKEVHKLANRVVRRIDTRFSKEWFPTSREGTIDYYAQWYDVNMDQGSWTVMARTNKIVNSIASGLRDEGYLYERFGRPSINLNYIDGIETWESLQNGDSVPIAVIKDFYKIVPKQGSNAVVKRGFSKSLDFLDPESSLDYDELVLNHGLLERKETPGVMVVNMSEDDQHYYRALIRKGEDVRNPRIKLSTIHAMKGGEDDNIMLLTESAYPCVETQFPDDEHRIFYTGITRTKKQLHLIETGSKYRYDI